MVEKREIWRKEKQAAEELEAKIEELRGGIYLQFVEAVGFVRESAERLLSEHESRLRGELAAVLGNGAFAGLAEKVFLDAVPMGWSAEVAGFNETLAKVGKLEALSFEEFGLMRMDEVFGLVMEFCSLVTALNEGSQSYE